MKKELNLAKHSQKYAILFATEDKNACLLIYKYNSLCYDIFGEYYRKVSRGVFMYVY